jgi:hypothetical protein
MPYLNHEIVGTIALSSALSIATDAGLGQRQVAEETTLGDLLAALTVGESSDCQPRRLVASARISRFVLPEQEGDSQLRADVTRLADELAHEYAELAGV